MPLCLGQEQKTSIMDRSTLREKNFPTMVYGLDNISTKIYMELRVEFKRGGFNGSIGLGKDLGYALEGIKTNYDFPFFLLL
jgi:hypothetical protein